MKTSRSLILLSVLAASLVWFGCEKNESIKKGTLDFGMNPMVETALKSLDAYYNDVVAALVSIQSENGELVYDKEYIEFYAWGDSFITKKLSLEVGHYHLTEFLLVDSSEMVIWATPLEGSQLAHLVNDPLPIYFAVSEGETTHLFPQVVQVGNYNPDEFGYVSFHVDFVDKACLNVFFEADYPFWDGNDSIWHICDSMYIDETGACMPVYPSRIAFFHGGELICEDILIPGENKVLYPRTYQEYRVVVYDWGNQICFNEFFGLEELKFFSCQNEEFLHIDCHPGIPDVIITPEDILKPTIEQGVFGRLTEPDYSDTLDYTEQYSIQPAIADLYIYSIMDMDSLYLPAEGCYVYPDPYIQPLAIVRSNSSGYYQLPLEVGEYQYLVRTPGGFYIDAYISSRVPGYFMVTQGEVSIINIHIEPCYWF